MLINIYCKYRFMNSIYGLQDRELFEVVLSIRNYQAFQNDVLGTPRFSVDYTHSTDISVCFNFHFDSVSFLTLYRVCNNCSTFSSLSLSKLFLAILKGQPTFWNKKKFKFVFTFRSWWIVVHLHYLIDMMLDVN
jgi:hypothetical protein